MRLNLPRPLLAIALAALAHAACQREPTAELRDLQPPEITATAVPEPPADGQSPPAQDPNQPAAVTAGPVLLTADDVVRSERVSQFLSDRTPPQDPSAWLRYPEATDMVVRQAIANRLLELDTATRGITVTPEQVAAELNGSSFADLVGDTTLRDQVLRTHAPLQWADLERAARLRLLHRAWNEQAAALTLTRDTLLDLWLTDMDRMQLHVVLVPNQPSPAQIQMALDSQLDDVRAWFDTHRGWFRLPPELPATFTDTSTLPDDELPGALAAASGAAAAATAAPGSSPITATERTLPAAFLHEPGHCYADEWQGVRGIVCVTGPRRRPSLQWDDPATQHLVAASMLGQQRPLPEPLQLAERIHQQWQSDPILLQSLLTEVRLDLQTTPWFSRASGGSIPILGDVPVAHRALFSLLQQPGDMPREPFLTPHGIAVVRLLERQQPDPADFDAVAEDYRQRIQPDFERVAFDRFVDSFLQQNPPVVHTELLREVEQSFRPQ